MAEATYDLVLYGATGFTGAQAAEYLASHPERRSFRFAVAGRSEERLEELAGRVAADGILVADGLDPEAVDAMVRQARVIATTAGPFARYGDEVVRACVERGVDYCDITGETPWVRTVIDRFHDRAAADGTRIVPFCGYDSIPSDLGTLYAVDRLHEIKEQACREVRAFHRGRGGLNGGTVASLVNLQKEGKTSELDDPFLLNPKGSRPAEERRHRDPLFPHWESDLGGWAAPFFMGPINTRVVRRSHALLAAGDRGYGPDFRYQEYWFSPGALGWFESSTLSTMQAMTGIVTRIPGSAGLIERVAPDPGTGPSEETMDRGYFRCDLVATGVDGDQLEVRLQGQGDPGNRITVKCLCESALALALDRDALPSGRGGILTPATAFGLELVPRLERAGISFAVV